MKIAFIADDYIIDPLGIAYLSSYLNEAGFSVELIKAEDDYVNEVKEQNPQMLCFSVTTANFRHYLKVNQEIQDERRIPAIFGGPHCTFFPNLQYEPLVYAICRGEGFDAIVDIAQNIAEDKTVQALRNIDWNPLRPLKDKATLLHPDRELIYQFPKNYNNPIRNVMASFGCMMSCAYCYASKYRKMYGIKCAELRPVEDVIDEIKELQKNYPTELIYFQDDIFPVYDEEWISEFCRLYSEIKIPFHIQVRIELISKEITKQLREVGMHGVTCAVESADEDFRKSVLNRRVSNAVIKENYKILKDAGLKTRVENMLGAPGETYEQALNTLRFNAELKPDIGWASVFQPYPGTQLGDKFYDEHDILPQDFFSYQNNGNRRTANLQKLFALGTRFPKTIPLINQATKLPSNSLFSMIYKISKQYLYDKRLYKIQ